MDWNAIMSHITPTSIGMVMQLAILEGLLSFDNALALAALVSGRLSHPEDRRHALLWGIWGAYIIRVAIVFVGVWLMEHEWIKFLAGLYLVWMAVNELWLKKHTAEEEAEESIEEILNDTKAKEPKRAPLKKIIGVIVAVELMDLMFSIDSIAVALAVSNEKWVLITGAILGILTMRIAASYFVKLITKFPILVPTAFVLVGIAGLKVMVEVNELRFGDVQIPMIGYHPPEAILLPLMFSILVGAMFYNYKFPERFKAKS